MIRNVEPTRDLSRIGHSDADDVGFRVVADVIRRHACWIVGSVDDEVRDGEIAVQSEIRRDEPFVLVSHDDLDRQPNG